MLTHNFLEWTTAFLTAAWSRAGWVDGFIGDLFLAVSLLSSGGFVVQIACSPAGSVERKWTVIIALVIAASFVLHHQTVDTSFITLAPPHKSEAATSFLGLALTILVGFVATFVASFVRTVIVSFFTLLRAGFILSIISLSICSLCAWTVVYVEIGRYILGTRPSQRDLRFFELLAHLSERRTAADELVALAATRLGGDSLANQPEPLRERYDRLRSLFLDLLTRGDIDEVFLCLRYLHWHAGSSNLRFQRPLPEFNSIVDPSFSVLTARVVLLVIIGEYTFLAAPLPSFFDELKSTCRAFAGLLVFYLLPLPPLRHLACPFTQDHLLSLLLTPACFAHRTFFRRNPAAWDEVGTSSSPITAAPVPTEPLRELLRGVAEWVVASHHGAVVKDVLTTLVARLVGLQASYHEAESERRLMDAILDAVLMWKQDKAALELRRRKRGRGV
ncbi:hypothetical protein JCM6882_007035 [Rhodosporidiobolus microsporus]